MDRHKTDYKNIEGFNKMILNEVKQIISYLGCCLNVDER